MSERLSQIADQIEKLRTATLFDEANDETLPDGSEASLYFLAALAHLESAHRAM